MAEASSNFREVWVESSGGRSLCALINGDIGFLMYLRYDGDGVHFTQSCIFGLAIGGGSVSTQQRPSRRVFARVGISGGHN
jgi:hypothetical protein